MQIKILGTGCPNCQKLESNAREAISDLKIQAEIEKVTEIEDIMSYGVMSTPALVVDGEVKIYGRVANAKEIKDLLAK